MHDDAPSGSSGLRVVLVNYNCFEAIETLLKSGVVSAQDEVYLVDNLSDPHRVQRLADDYGATAILLDSNTGFARGVNAALARIPAASSGATLLLNPDVLLTRGDINRLLSELMHSDLDALTPVLRNESGRIWVSTAGGRASLWSAIAYFGGLSHLVPTWHGFFWTRTQIVKRRGRPQWLCGAALLVRDAAWRRFGWLPEYEHMYGEDVAWGLAAVKRGARLGISKDVEAVHVGGASGGSQAWQDATERVFLRECGSLTGRAAVAVMRAGLRLRGVVRRALGA